MYTHCCGALVHETFQAKLIRVDLDSKPQVAKRQDDGHGH